MLSNIIFKSNWVLNMNNIYRKIMARIIALNGKS